MRHAIEAYLAKTGAGFPKTLSEVVASGKFHPLHEVGLRDAAVAPAPDAASGGATAFSDRPTQRAEGKRKEAVLF